MIERRVLVVGATGQLGRVIVSKLLAAGVPVRALARGRDKLADLATAGAEVMAADMLDAPAMAAACGDVDQVVATANNNMGRGVTSPRRVDVRGYQNLCEAARRAGVRRLLYTSFRGASPDTGVDIFTLKWQIEDVVRRSGVPWVLVRPSAFADTWANEVLGGGIRKNGVTMIFGDGRRVCNYVTVADVAEFVVRILARDDVQNEVIEIGGPSDLSLTELATLVERALGAPGKRRHIPVAAMQVLPLFVRPFNEVAARLMTLGCYVATRSTPFPQWRESAERFGVTPATVDAYVATLSR